MHGALGALRSLVRLGEQLARGVLHRGGAVADRLEDAFGAVAEIADRGVDRDAAILLRLHGVALLLQLLLFGHVLMRRDPTAARHRLVDDVDDAAVACLDQPVEGLSLRDAVHDVADVLIDVAGEIAGLLAMHDELAQRAAGPHDLRLEIVHREVRTVAHHDAAVRVEHAQALRHVVERRHQMAAGLAEPDGVNGERRDEDTCRRERHVEGGQKLGHGAPGNSAANMRSAPFGMVNFH